MEGGCEVEIAAFAPIAFSVINQNNISQSYYIYTHIIINCSFKSRHTHECCSAISENSFFFVCLHGKYFCSMMIFHEFHVYVSLFLLQLFTLYCVGGGFLYISHKFWKIFYFQQNDTLERVCERLQLFYFVCVFLSAFMHKHMMRV